MVYRRKGIEKKKKQSQSQASAQTKQTEDEEPDEIPGDGQIFKRKSHRESWIGRSLSTRGRKSIAFARGKGSKPNLKGRQPKKKPKRSFPNKRLEAPPVEFVKENVNYFQEVDSFELDEEDNPSPTHRWKQSSGEMKQPSPIQNIRTLTGLGVVWEETGVESFTQTPNAGVRSGSDLLSSLLQTPLYESQSPASPDVLISSDGILFHKIKSLKHKEYTDEQDATTVCSSLHEVIPDSREKASPSTTGSISEAFENMHIIDLHKSENFRECETLKEHEEEGHDEDVGVWNIEAPSSEEDESDILPPLDKLLKICQQTRPLRLSEAFSEFCDASSIVKIGEGTFGEAFKGGGNVFKIVPVDGDFLVNGEVQKTCADLFVEVLLSITLNCLRGDEDKTANKSTCINYIETKAIRVCQGTYDTFLVKAWEDWDEKHSSENDHPMIFPEKQLYTTFILADGGHDLESFVLSDFDEVRSVLIQVTASLAVAEVACEFEHRDLHWGNILLSRDKTKTTQFIMQGKEMEVQTFGLSVAIIDFTLSRINTGNQVLFLDLSADPALFEGPKRDTQAETYRRMLNVTQGNWEGRYPKTNTLWLHYLADTLLTKKAFRCSPKDKRTLQAFRKRLLLYESAEAALSDSFFHGMWVGSEEVIN